MEWQPIETAPKDGTGIIAGWMQYDMWNYRISYWFEGEWCIACTDINCAPTHWMPLPEPPQCK